MANLRDALYLAAIGAGMAAAIALGSDPAQQVVEAYQFEQTGRDTICEQIGRGEWRCQDELPRIVWSASR